MKAVTALAALAVLGPAAVADGWLVAETPAAVAVSDAQAGVFTPGVMPAVGAYADNGWLALGVRLRAGVLRDGRAPGGQFKDPGLGGLTTASFAVRLQLDRLGNWPIGGGWVEGALGGGVTGSDVVPAVEIGAGWTFDLGNFEMGPSVRLARLSSTSDMDTLGTAKLVLVGVDLRFGRDHENPPRRSYPRIEPIAIAQPRIEVSPDRDAIVLREPSCRELVDGCTFGSITVVNDRIVLDERVLFDLDRARVRTGGKTIVRAIADLWAKHPEWKSFTIEGHADSRGSDDYNTKLSQLRADRVRDVLVDAGADPSSVQSIGYGRSRPRDAGTSETSHQRNRRVEFVIERRVEQFQ